MPPAVKVQSLNHWTVGEVPLPTEIDRPPFLLSHLNFEGVLLKESSPFFLQHHLLSGFLTILSCVSSSFLDAPSQIVTSSLSYT